MKTNFVSKNTQKEWRISSNWLLFLFLFTFLSFSACVPPQNLATGERISRKNVKSSFSYGGLVHSRKSHKKRHKKKINKIAPKTETNYAIAEFESKMNSPKAQEKNITKTQVKPIAKKKSLPSLKEQVAKLNSQQNNLGNSIKDMQNDMQEMKNLLRNISTAKQNNSEVKTVKTATYTPSSQSQTSKEELGTFILESDEVSAGNMKQKTNKKIVERRKIKSQKKQATLKSQKNKTLKTVNKPKIKSQKNTKEDKKQTNVILTGNQNRSDFSDIIKRVAKGDYNAAKKSISQKMKVAKNAADISDCHYWLGECNLKQKEYNKAINNFKIVLNGLSDKKDAAQAKLAECYLRTGKNNEAKAAYQSLLQNFPRSSQTPRAKRMLQQL